MVFITSTQSHHISKKITLKTKTDAVLLTLIRMKGLY